MASNLKASVEAVIVFNRSEGERAAECACCDGAHIYGRDIELIEKGKARPYPGLTLNSVEEFLNDAIIEPAWEGRRVRVTIEAID